MMPTMINNIASCHKRTALIMKIVIEEVKGNDERQFLILSDRKQHLEDMFKIAKDAGIESVGYYVGGMKKEKLNENESCKILLGTYPMANEGLDIPSLNGLVLSTPKSEIIQSIGRICRVKHETIQPIIIDVVDKFSIFENQGRKRFTVYKGKKYEIEDISYNLDKDVITMMKKYHFHNCFGDESDEEDVKKGKKIEKTEKTEKEEIESLFKSFSLFK